MIAYTTATTAEQAIRAFQTFTADRYRIDHIEGTGFGDWRIHYSPTPTEPIEPSEAEGDLQ